MDQRYLPDDNPDGYPNQMNFTETGDHSADTIFGYIMVASFLVCLAVTKCYRFCRTSNHSDNTLCQRIIPQEMKKTILFQGGSPRLCTICLEEYKDEEPLTQLKCKHQYHPICIESWFERQKSCPTCRMDLLG